MVNYGNSKIFKIENKIDNKIFIGSTVTDLKTSLSLIKSSARTKHNLLQEHYKTIGWKNAIITLIENFECKNRTELLQRERYHYDLLHPELNEKPSILREDEFKSYILTPHRYTRSDEIDPSKQKYQKEYRVKNQDMFKEKIECQCGGHYTYGNKNTHAKTRKHLLYLSTL